MCCEERPFSCEFLAWLHPYVHTHTRPKTHTHNMQNANANSLSGSHTPGSHYERSQAKNFRRKAYPHSKWCGHPKSHLDHCCCMRKDLEFAPQQMPSTQSQLGGLVGGRGRKKPNEKFPEWGLNSGPQALSQEINQYTNTHTQTHTHTHTILDTIFHAYTCSTHTHTNKHTYILVFH